MSDDERARLYRQIVQSTSDEFLVERMRMHGFWPAGRGLPSDPPDEVRERREIENEIAELRRQHAAVADPEKALAEERQRRWEESKARRAELRAERAAETERRRAEYETFREGTIVHAGEGVSAGLQEDVGDPDALEARGLPVLLRSENLAEAIGLPIGTLRWLTYHRRAAAVVHYHRYDIAKKTGGVRSISAPKPQLAHCQEWVLGTILARLEVTPCAHGFVPGRSVLTNAAPHVGREVVVNLDLRDFFPSITFRRVKGLFRAVGYGEHVATTLALLCTEPPRVATGLNGRVYHVSLGDRVLPQGACTSPALSNAVCRRLDRRLQGLARRHEYAFTRYADDLTFSGNDPAAIGKLLRSIRSIVEDEGFVLHPEKTRVMRASSRQEVTGVVVNERPTVVRTEVRQLRAILHNARRSGLAAQNRTGRPDFVDHLRGRIAFIQMVDPRRGAPLAAAFDELLAGR